MVVQRFVGFISPDTILQHSRIDSWALPWLNRAQKADAQGMQLVVFEISKKEWGVDILDLELGALQSAFEMNLDFGQPGTRGVVNEIMSAFDDL